MTRNLSTAPPAASEPVAIPLAAVCHGIHDVSFSHQVSVQLATPTGNKVVRCSPAEFLRRSRFQEVVLRTTSCLLPPLVGKWESFARELLARGAA